MKKIILILSTLALMNMVNAQEDDAVDSYGDLFLVEEKIALDSSIEQLVSLGSVVNHSAFNVYFLKYDLSFYFNNFFSYGVDVMYNHIFKRKFFDTVSGVIENDGSVVARYPKMGAHGYLGFTPIKGSLNWLNSRNYSFYVLTKFGAGMMYDTDEKDNYLSYFGSATLKFEVTKSWGFLFGIRQQFFTIKGRQERSTALEVGAAYIF